MNGVSSPLVSVLMPYYNGRAFMREAIQSVLDQTYQPIEIVVIDDASSRPEDAQYIEALTQELGLKLIKNASNEGPSRTMARAFTATHGTLIGELSQDDLYLPDKIQAQVEALRQQDWDAVYAAGDIMYQASGEVEPRRVEKTRAIIASGQAVAYLQQKNLPGISLQGLLAKRAVFTETILPIWQDYLLDDWPVHIRLFERHNVGFMDGPLWRSRAHPHNSSWQIWRLLGPQIEVVARMTPVETRMEAIGNRLTSLARRVHKQGGDAHTITRLTLAGLMLVDSQEQRRKAQRILYRIAASTRRTVTGSKLEQLQACDGDASEDRVGPQAEPVGWETLGKVINQAIQTTQDDEERLFRLGCAFAGLAPALFEAHSFAEGTQAALCALMLMGETPARVSLVHCLRAVPWEGKQQLIADKTRLLKACRRFGFRSLWR